MATVEAGIEQIRTEQPVKNTIHNPVQTLSIKLDSAARYGLYQEDARTDGYEDCAEMFGRLADHRYFSRLSVLYASWRYRGSSSTSGGRSNRIEAGDSRALCLPGSIRG